MTMMSKDEIAQKIAAQLREEITEVRNEVLALERMPAKHWGLFEVADGQKWELMFSCLEFATEDKKDWTTYATISLFAKNKYMWKVVADNFLKPGVQRRGQARTLSAASNAAMITKR